MSENTNNVLIQKLRVYKQKYYLNLLIKGVIISLSLILTFFLLANYLEYSFRFTSAFRTFLFFSIAITFIWIIYHWVINPTYRLFDNRRQISNQEAARQIGHYFPEVNDKLLNTLQLQLLTQQDSDLIIASILQKSKQIALVPFTQAIDFSENKRYLKYLVVPVSFMVAILVFIPQLLSESSNRIIHFTKKFVPEPPFQFIVQKERLLAFKNEDYTLKVSLEGNALPENLYIIKNSRRIKLQKGSNTQWESHFEKIQSDLSFYLEAAGFRSITYLIQVVDRPNLKGFNVFMKYPRYLKKENQRFENVGNLQIPEGTHVRWQFNTFKSEKVSISFSNDSSDIVLQESDNQIFEYEKRMFRDESYGLKLENQHSVNKDQISYRLTVIEDQFPKIKLDQYRDTTLFKYIILGGNIWDDYGLTRLQLYYQVQRSNLPVSQKFESVIIPFDTKLNNQSYYYQWDLEGLKLQQVDRLKYYLQVWDNDEINGRKSVKTAEYAYKIPSREEVKKELSKSSGNTQNQIDKTSEEAQKQSDKIEEIEQRLRGKKDLSWQDEKLLQELLKEREELEKEIQKLQNENLSNSQKRERFNQQNDKIKEKVKQLQSLMDELLDEETKKLYDELQKLLEEQNSLQDIQDVLQNLKNKENNLEKELERAIELFKRMKFEYKLDEVINELNEVAEEQEKLSHETSEKNIPEEDLLQKQDTLNQDFEDVKNEMDELQELNQDLDHPQPVQDTSDDQEAIDQEQQKSKEMLERGKRKKASQSQKNASDRMKQLSQKLQQMQMSMEMTMLQENLDHLRDIVDNLVKLSFGQESLMKEFRKVNQSGPRFIELSQKQLKLKDDSKIIEDSLLSLANRVFQIQSFITREVGAMNESINSSLEAIKERKKAIATSEQQFSMTSINNLAILLDDVLQQMQMQMADAMGRPTKKGKPNKHKAPSMAELQQQLNQKIEELKKSGKTGRPLSEALAKLAAEQEQLRQLLEEINQKSKGEYGGEEGLDKIIDKMEETEKDLVNKNIATETIKRQKEILTRLLEAEDALRERELDDEREAEKAKQYQRQIPKEFEEYIKTKEEEIELLKTVPVKLNPYYKKEVNDYFQRINSK